MSGIGIGIGLFPSDHEVAAEEPFDVSEFAALAAEWDMSNAGSRHVTGGELLQLDDLSGNGRDISGSSGFVPTYNATGAPNGGPCADFAHDTALRRSSFVAAQAYTLIMVLKVGADDGYLFQHFDFAGVIHGLQFGIDNTGKWKLSHTAGGGVQTTAGAAGSGWQVVTIVGGTGASFTPIVRVNGVVVSAFSDSAYSAPGASTWSVGLGFLNSGTSGTTSLAHAYLCDGEEDETVIARAEASLAEKWGVAA